MGSCSSAFPSFDPKHLVESERISSFFQRENAFYHGVTFGFNRSANRGNRHERRRTIKQLDGKTPNKVIIVQGK
jgi:leucyl-tRNA synthetase